MVEAHEYVTELLEVRRATPGPDLISTLLAAAELGDRLTHDECVNLVLNLLAGGVDTTQSQLSQALRLFAEHPGQWALLAAEPDTYVQKAVQEALRFEPIVPFTARIVLEDIEHRGVLFPAGTVVAVCAERANRETPDGEAFDITAERDGKLYTFGAGRTSASASASLGPNWKRPWRSSPPECHPSSWRASRCWAASRASTTSIPFRSAGVRPAKARLVAPRVSRPAG